MFYSAYNYRVHIYIAGINGMVGSAIARESAARSFQVSGKSSNALDLKDRDRVFQEMHDHKPDFLVIAAARVGGIWANASKPVEFLSENLQIQTNLIDAAHAAKVNKVLFLGSSCIYPKFAPQPIQESSILTGTLEETNEAYAIAKIAGVKLIQAYRKQHGNHWISAMPTNLYGPQDNFDLQSAHVLPALIHRFHKAKSENLAEIEIWGDGTPLREFLHVNDLALACFTLLEKYDDEIAINIGSGIEITIKELSVLVARIVGYDGKVGFNSDYPNGTPRKLLSSTRINEIGWKPSISLEDGIRSTYEWFLSEYLERFEQ